MRARAKTSRARFWQLGAATALTALFVAAVWPALAQFGSEGRVTDFKYRVLYDVADRRISVTNRVRTLVLGAKGLYLTNDLAHVTSPRLENYEPGGAVTNLVAIAPECFVDTSSRLAWSTGRLELIGLQRRLSVKGDEGFLFYLTNSTLIVSNHVRTYIHPELLRSASP